MTKNEFNNIHQQVWSLLPWYLTQTLSREEDVLVESHLAECLMCRQELGQQKVIKQAVNLENEEVNAVNRTLNSLHQRIGGRPEKTPSANPWNGIRQLIQVIRASHFGLQTILAAQTAVIALAAVLLLNDPQPQRFQTLTSPPQEVKFSRTQYKIIFAEDLTLTGLQTLLENHKLNIISGPSPAGAYQLKRLPINETDATRVDDQDTKDVLASLENHPKVLFVKQI